MVKIEKLDNQTLYQTDAVNHCFNEGDWLYIQWRQ